jgi:hypothetical protein
MFRLVQAKKVFIEPISHGQALAELIANTPIVAAEAIFIRHLLNQAAELISSIPVYRLHFLPDDSFWDVVSPILAKENYDKK